MRHHFETDKQRRFGNFIGEEAEASEEESQHGADAGNYVYDDEDADEDQDAAGQELMEVDGKDFVPLSWLYRDLTMLMGSPWQMVLSTRSYSMKTNNTILPPHKYTGKAWRRWCKRRMRNH